MCALFDSVYISMYKGIGGIAGAVLAGGHKFTEQSKIWKRRHGGDLISLYPYILSADYYFNQRQEKMEQYYKEAKELAGFYNECHRVYLRPAEPVSNMFHVHFQTPKGTMESLLAELYEESGIGLSGHIRDVNGQTSCFEVSIGDRYVEVPKEKLKGAFEKLDKKMREL